jgi:hypothetical protein
MWFDRVEAFIFSDGSTFSWEQIIQTMNANAGTAGDDMIYGFSYEDVLDGGACNDLMSGGNAIPRSRSPGELHARYLAPPAGYDPASLRPQRSTLPLS